MYEWETEVSKETLKINLCNLRAEASRIANTTLRGNFVNPEDREYWVKKLAKINDKIDCTEKILAQ